MKVSFVFAVQTVLSVAHRFGSEKVSRSNECVIAADAFEAMNGNEQDFGTINRKTCCSGKQEDRSGITCDSKGHIIEIIWDCSNKTLIVDENKCAALDGAIPSKLAKLDNLKKLVMDGNKGVVLDSSSLSYLSKMKQLEYLSLSFAADPSSGSTLPQDFLEGLNKLKVLDLSGNGITGKVPESFGKLKNLENFFIGANDFSGKFPSIIFNNCR
jgi:hypothetical protein